MKRRTLMSAVGCGAAVAMVPALAAKPAKRAKPSGAGKPSPETAIGRIRTAGVLKVGVVQQFPWSTMGADRAWKGFDIDVCNRLFADLGVRAEFVDSAWEQAADDVVQKVVDIAARLWPMPRRALIVNFSHAYGTSQTTLVANRQKAGDRTTLDAFNQPDDVIGVRGGSEGERVVRMQLPKAQIRVVKDEVDALGDLESGQLHAVVALTPLPEILAARASALLVLPRAKPLVRHSEAFAVRVDDIDTLAFLNTWIGFSEETGWLAERRAYWFSGKALG